MQRCSKPVLFLIPALVALSACDAPTETPAEPVDDQSLSDDFTSDQPVVDDPMAGETVVEEAPELGSGATEETADGDATESETDAAAEDAATAVKNKSTDDETDEQEYFHRVGSI